MATYFVYGYFGNNNIGDELILAGFLKALFKKAPDTEKVIVSSKLSGNQFLRYHKDGFAEGRVEFIDRSRNPLSISNLSAVLKSECFIVPGGGIFQDYGVLSFLCYFSQAAAAKILFRKVFLLNQGFTGIKRRFFSSVMRWGVRNLFDYVSVRDEFSFERYLIKDDFKFPVSASTYSDLVFILSAELKDAVSRAAVKNDAVRETAGFAFRPWKGFSAKDMAACVEKVVDETGMKAVLYPMQYPEDSALNAEILECVSGRNKNSVSAADFSSDPVSFFKSVSLNRLNIGMRFHFSVLSAIAGAPCIGISYDDKVSGFYREAGLPELCAVLDGVKTGEDIATEVCAKLKLAEANYSAISDTLLRYSNMKAEISEKLFDEFISTAAGV